MRCAQMPPPSPSPPANPPANDSTNPSPHRLRRNRHDYDKSGGRRYRGSVDEERVLLGERKCYGRGGARRRYGRGRRQARGSERRMTTLGGAEALRRGAGDSVTGVSDGRCQEPSAGPLLWAGGVTGVADRCRDNRCPGRRGKRWSHGRSRAASPEGRAPALPEEDRRHCRRGRR